MYRGAHVQSCLCREDRAQPYGVLSVMWVPEIRLKASSLHSQQGSYPLGHLTSHPPIFMWNLRKGPDSELYFAPFGEWLENC